MSKTLLLEIVSPERKIFGRDVRMIIARATTGELGILPGHFPLVALLDARPVRILNDEGEQQIIITGGIMLVKPEMVTILTDP
jgi:F-type H+-transporting ATPase subunit epsilon